MQLKSIFSLGFLCLSASAADAQATINTNRTMKSLSRDECVRLAVEHNLRIQVLQFDPNLRRFELEAAKGFYDPSFTTEYVRSSSSREGSVDPVTGLTGSSTTSDEDRFTPGLGGFLPTGMRYDLMGDFRHTRGMSGQPFDDYTASAGIQMNQPLLRNSWIDSPRTEIQVRKRELKVSEMALEQEIRLVILDVHLLYHELMFSLGDQTVKQKAYEVATNFVAEQRAKVAVGNLAEIEVKQAESQAATALTDFIEAQRRVTAAGNALKNLVTDEYQNWLNVRIEPTEKLVAVPERLDLSESWASALEQRPDLKRLELQGEILELDRKRWYNQLFPELDVTGGYGRSGVDRSFSSSGSTNLLNYNSRLGAALDDIAEARNPRWNVGVLFRLPLSRQVERNRYKASKEEEKKNQILLKQLHQSILLEVDNAIDQARSNYERISSTRQARVFAEVALEAEEKKLAAGTGTIFQVLQRQKDLTQARSDEIRALTDYLNSLTVVHHRDGSILQREKVSIRYK
jgi:outer membrane protein TolC